MKRNDLIFAAILVPIDYLTVMAAGWAAYSIRFERVAELLPVVTAVPFSEYMRAVSLLGWLWILMLAMSGVYAVRRISVSAELSRIAAGSSLAILIVIVTIFFQREYVASRFIVIVGWILSIGFLWLVHLAIRLVQRWLRGYRVGISRTVIFGAGPVTDALVNAAHEQKTLGIEIIKTYPEISLSSLDDFEELIRNEGVDLALAASPDIPKAQTMQVLDRCNDANVSFAYAADIFETETRQMTIRDVAGIPIIEIQRTPLEGWGRIFKRAFDIVGSLLGILIFFIPGLIIAIAIKLDSAGPVFKKLERVGQGQRRFALWKFRSMVKDAETLKPSLLQQNERGDGPLFKLTHDPRITRVGRFIRRTSLDELPQFFNVLLGNMSLVGPRPHEPAEVARYDRHHKRVLIVKPGMTGMAQVSGRSNLSFEEEVRLDTYYIEHWSFGLDIQILFRTPLVVLSMKSAV